jgi:hypothetical protein
MAETPNHPFALVFARFLSGFVLTAALAGCTGHDDPFQRPGTWHLTYDNDANLAAMVADKHHLVEGVGDPASPGVLSAQAVHRLLTDHVKPLPTTEIGPIGGSAQSGSGGQ